MANFQHFNSFIQACFWIQCNQTRHGGQKTENKTKQKKTPKQPNRSVFLCFRLDWSAVSAVSWAFLLWNELIKIGSVTLTEVFKEAKRSGVWVLNLRVQIHIHTFTHAPTSHWWTFKDIYVWWPTICCPKYNAEVSKGCSRLMYKNKRCL